MAFSLTGIKSLLKGLEKIDINYEIISNDLDNNWVVLCEAIQTVLKKNHVSNAYEKLKMFSRNNKTLNKKEIKEFIDLLDIDTSTKKYLHTLTPFNYTGKIF